MQPFLAGMSHQVEAHIIGSQMCVGYIFCLKKTFTFKATHIVANEFLNF